MDDQSRRIIFGLKVKQLRKNRDLSFAELSKKSGLSISYLNEIEKAKKYPRQDKIKALAKALDTSEKKLTSMHLDKKLAPLGELLHSNLLSELPLDLFGLDAGKIVELLAEAPTKVGAFISALMGIARRYALEQENFYFASLRSYQSLHDNYFEELEDKAAAFIKEYDLPTDKNVPIDTLLRVLKRKYRYKIDASGFGEHYEELKSFRSIFLPEQKKLIINSQITDIQRAFLLGKEIAYNYLKLKERVYTSTFVKVNSFEEVLNNFKASYFSGAILINQDELVSDMRKLFSQETWQPQQFAGLVDKYKSSPEMLFHRLMSIIPRYFGLENVFFLRFNHNIVDDSFSLSKELHLNRQHHPYGNGLLEHYCRRWITIWLLQDLQRIQEASPETKIIAGAQRSKFIGTDDEYLCLSLARPAYPTPNINVSVTIGIWINDALRKRIAFVDDPAIPVRQVNQPCERCPAVDCAERVAEPTIIEQENKQIAMRNALAAIMEKG